MNRTMLTTQTRHSVLQLIALFLGLLLLNTLPLTADAKMYKWVDANGKKHFSDKPPPKDVVGNVKEYKPKQRLHYNKEASPEQKQQREEFLRERQKQADKNKAQQREAGQDKKRYATYCKKQRIHYKALADKKYRRYLNDDGEYQVYTDETRAKRLKEIKRDIQKYCK